MARRDDNPDMFRLLIAILVLMLAYFGYPVSGQNQRPCDHRTNSKERFDAIRLLPPVKVRNYDGKLIEYTYEDRKGIYAGSFEIGKDTVVDSKLPKRYKDGFWWAMYSACDNYLYLITPVQAEQILKK